MLEQGILIILVEVGTNINGFISFCSECFGAPFAGVSRLNIISDFGEKPSTEKFRS